jgi:hypothetical protein
MAVQVFWPWKRCVARQHLANESSFLLRIKKSDHCCGLAQFGSLAVAARLINFAPLHGESRELSDRFHRQWLLVCHQVL